MATFLDRSREPGLINLGAAIMTPDFLPLRALKRAVRRVLSNPGFSPWQYGPAEGIAPLREAVAVSMRERGCRHVSADEIIISGGTQHAIELSLSALTAPGDLVACEIPSYYGTLNLLSRWRLKMVPVRSGFRTGVNPEDLERVLKKKAPRVLILTPSYNNPTGSCMPAARRREVMVLCEKYGVWVIEDDIYGAFAHSGQPPRPLKAMDKGDRVFYCSSFSKTVAPGFRLGYCIPPRRLRAAVAHQRFSQDLCGAMIPQFAMVEFLKEGQYAAHLDGLRRAFVERLAFAQTALESDFPEDVRYTCPDGGYLTWLTWPVGRKVSSRKMYKAALQKGLMVAPGEIFFAQGEKSDGIRIHYGVRDLRVLGKAFEILGTVFRKAFKS